MFKPKKYETRWCTQCHNTLEPHVKTMQFVEDMKVYHIDYWFCSECGLMYHFKDMKQIVERD